VRSEAMNPGRKSVAVTCRISRSIVQYPCTTRLRNREGCCHPTSLNRDFSSSET
jgi:hypothetical protein